MERLIGTAGCCDPLREIFDVTTQTCTTRPDLSGSAKIIPDAFNPFATPTTLAGEGGCSLTSGSRNATSAMIGGWIILMALGLLIIARPRQQASH